ncbi:MAG: NAD(+) kinase [Algicola sp.]|nr:NAD(+) kinase [Algicola sp.]
MSQAFSCIGLIGKPNHQGANNTLISLYNFLKARDLRVIVDSRISPGMDIIDIESLELADLGKVCDLAIVVGGDGYMLGAARTLSRFDVAVIGVNRGNLGFLTDLDPESFEAPLTDVLDGKFQVEYRFLLETRVIRQQQQISVNCAVNEVVLHADKIAHMIEFEAFIKDQFVFRQRSDGLIISTPTGSTAYSLSGGGPILNPNLDAISMVPMFPHTLNSRPLVVDSNSEIKLKVSPDNDADMQVSCDSHISVTVLAGDEIIVQKSANRLKLVHPEDYSYYRVLRKKLGWGSQLY